MSRVRCAIYTRKSSDEGLEQDFNSLDAQRDACAAFVQSQAAEGWVLLPKRYDDGGQSGGSLDRPAVQRLLADIDVGLVDRVIVYKIDRLTRSLADFSKIIDRLDAAGASFVSVTQSFNTATSMGRLTLNMLLSFAQFEREVTAERIRDKIAASKRKGMWMGGRVPLGYRADGRSLKIDVDEAETVKALYALYDEMRTVSGTVRAAAERGLTMPAVKSKSGKDCTFSRAHVHHILTNPIYAGRIRHREAVYPGNHPAIINPERWDAIQKDLTDKARRSRGQVGTTPCSPLAGKLFDETGDRLTPSHSRKGQRRLRYYISHRLTRGSAADHPDAWRLPAAELERCIAVGIRTWLYAPESLAALLPKVEATELLRLNERTRISGFDDAALLRIIDRSVVARSRVTIHLNAETLASALELDADDLEASHLGFSLPFRQRRRHRETKLVLETSNAPVIDTTLIGNIVQAQRWFADLRAGLSFADIASRDNVSKRRVQDVVDLAFLAPDLIKRIVEGTQSEAMTSDRLIKGGVPARWEEQRAAFCDC